MRKLIDIKDSQLPALKHAARLYGRTVKRFCEDVIYEAIQNDTATYQKSNVIDDEPETGTTYQPDRDRTLDVRKTSNTLNPDGLRYSETDEDGVPVEFIEAERKTSETEQSESEQDDRLPEGLGLTRRMMRDCGKELNSEFGLEDPAIDLTATNKHLLDELREAKQFVVFRDEGEGGHPRDVLSDDTWLVLSII